MDSHEAVEMSISILEKTLTCYFCGELVTKRGNNGECLIVHSLDGNHNNWAPENKVPVHRKCHNTIHLKGKSPSEETRRKQSEWATKHWNNLLAKELISLVSSCKTKFLFPKGEPFTGRPIADQHTSTTRIYLKVLEISTDLWSHYLRAQRASFNVFVRKMNLFQLMDWFKWKGTDTPAHYINQTLEGMAKQMGIKNIPS